MRRETPASTNQETKKESSSMINEVAADPGRHASWIITWFALDAVVALAPPLYWAVDGIRTSVLGLPIAVLYFVAVAVFITASIVTAYLAESLLAEAG
jgi:putative effector of murein hydrolase